MVHQRLVDERECLNGLEGGEGKYLHLCDRIRIIDTCGSTRIDAPQESCVYNVYNTAYIRQKP